MAVAVADLPPELFTKVLQQVSPFDVFQHVAQTCVAWRWHILHNVRRLPLFPVHCHVFVSDTDAHSSPSLDTNVDFAFSVYDPSHPKFEQKRRVCIRGNDTRFRVLHVYQRGESLVADLESSRSYGSRRLDARSAAAVMSRFSVVSLRFIVHKARNRTRLSNIVDERLHLAISFFEKHCARVDIRSLHVAALIDSSPWSLGAESERRLVELPALDTLVFENLRHLDVFSGQLRMNFSRLKELRLRLDPRHGDPPDMEHPHFVSIDGAFLDDLAAARVPYVEVSVFADAPLCVSAITAADICSFVRKWRVQRRAWPIKGIHLNTQVSISEMRAVATRLGLFSSGELADVPYCRFRSSHAKQTTAVLELVCYGSGPATLWSIRTGFLGQVTKAEQRLIV